ncbi:MAG: hypothetical protein HRT74_08815 [Flavobacteriales bacterium]|nr:hypothetical protein [Flavobacteriales bacterium]
MSREQAELINKILTYGVKRLDAAPPHQDQVNFQMRDIKEDLELKEPVPYLIDLMSMLTQVKPCPVTTYPKHKDMFGFSEVTRTFLNKGGFIGVYDRALAEEKKREIREQNQDELTLKSIKGSKIVYISAIISFLALVVSIIALFKN